MNNDLPGSFWTMPQCASTTLDRKSLKNVLLSHDGKILSCGRMWDIKSKSIGAGVYKVWLEEQKWVS